MAQISIQTGFPKGSDPADWQLGPFRFFKQSGLSANKHTLVEDPAQADFILYADSGTGPHFESIRRDAVYRRWRKKCFVFCRDDYPVPVIPGLYASIPQKWHHLSWARTGFYVHDSWIGLLKTLDQNAARKHLYSFCGSCTNDPVRLQLRDHSGANPVYDSSGMVIPAYTSGDSFMIRALRDAFINYSLESSFVLCPRGRGCGSIRLFEVMEMGRVPVIISDDWVPLEGIDWEAFSIRVAEKDVSLLDEILPPYLSKRSEMEIAARKAWEQYFSPESVFDYVGDELAGMVQTSRSNILKHRLSQVPRLASPSHLVRYMRQKLKSA